MKKAKINSSIVVKSILLAAIIMLLSLFFFIPYITEAYTNQSISKHAQNSVEQIKLTRAYYTDAVVGDVKKYAPELSFSYDHEGIDGKIPLPTTTIHDLSKIFSQNTGIKYNLYSEYPFTNRADRVLTPFQKEALKFTKQNPNGIYVKRDVIDNQQVLRVATTDYMTSPSCVNCHNNHPDKTWGSQQWKVGDSRGVLEVITPIEEELVAHKEMRDYILLFIFVIFSAVLFFLSRSFIKREKELLDVKDTLEITVDNKEHQLEALSHLVNEHMISSKTDTKGVITSVSQAFLDISGYSEEELLKHSHNIVRHPDMDKSVYKEMWKTLKEGKPWSGDLKNRAKDGSIYYVHATIIPGFNTNGKLVEYISFREDITEKVLTEHTLEEERQLNQIILDNQEEILLMSTQNNGVININNKFLTTFDFKDLKDFKEHHQCICELFIHKEGYLKRSEGSDWTKEVLANPDTMHKALMLNKKGKEAIFLARVKKITIAEEEHYITTFTDITELEKARELAESSEKAKANFMANMSHELRTPLNGITGFTQLLTQTPVSEKQSKYLSMIETSSHNLLGIVNDILDFSKIESGNMELEYKKSDLFMEIESTVNLFKTRAKDKNLNYKLDMDPTISPCLMIDALRLSQILSNLISNAIKFTPENGTVTVSIKSVVKHKGYEELHFAISDTGIGIPKDRQKAIFEAFTQADTSTTREFGGTGLGLSISVSLVQVFGGELKLESEENKGSTFFFNIEAKRCEKEQTAQKALIIEECEMTKIMIEELLKQHNIVTEVVHTKEELLSKLSKEEYRLLFIGMNHTKSLAFIKESSPALPIIALGSSDSDKEKAEILSGYIDNYLNKPLELDAFNLIVERYLSK
ncbi:MAG: PAS domain S-box protein [Epsilonproteobacteria bacterium]|nr:PAS domain S-box protein [Campylobacterota bacterium]